MMKTYKIVLLIVSFMLIGCGGGATDNPTTTEDNKTIEIDSGINENNETEDNKTIEIDSGINENNETEDNETIEIDNGINENNETEDNETIEDTTPPQIILNGEANISMLQGDIYNELGAVAEDNNISIPVDVYGFVDNSTLGEYNITYSATDEAGNSASVLRRVLVKARRTPYNIVETIPQNWYIRLVAKDLTREFKTENTQLGVLEGDNIALKHSLKALAPFGSSYLDIVFPNPAGVASGEYKSSFYKSSDTLANVWNFRVKTEKRDATIELGWRGVYVVTPYDDEYNRTRYKEKLSSTNPLIEYMKLIDMTTGEEIPAVFDGRLQKYQFSMDGATTKDFQWVVDDYIVDINISNRTPRLSSRRARVVATPTEVEPFDIHRVPRSETFDRYTR